MKWQEWLDKWSMTALKIKTPFLDMEWAPLDQDKDAAWELYIELLTRITTQPLADEHGVEETALNSVYKIFPMTREVIKRNGRHCVEFTKIAIVVLNQVIRPFTAKWHKVSVEDGFADPKNCQAFREELAALQALLNIYTAMLGEMAGVEHNLLELEDK